MSKYKKFNFKAGKITSNSIVDESNTLDKILQDFNNNLFFQVGEKLSFSGIPCAGCLTGGQSYIYFTLAVPKKMDKITKVAIDSMTVSMRHANGGYIGSDGVNPKTLGTLNAYIRTPNLIEFELHLSSKSSFTNNCPVSVRINNCNLTFS